MFGAGLEQSEYFQSITIWSNEYKPARTLMAEYLDTIYMIAQGS